MLAGKKIIIGITGSIAAFKIPMLVRLLVKEKANVRVIMTPAARDFITPLTLSTLSGASVLSEPFNPVDGSWNNHVDLGNWADLLLIAPASANTMGKMAHGIADNFLLTVYLSAKCPVYFAPAMDLDMYKHPSTKENIKKLHNQGAVLIEPQVGELASGLTGPGRMEEPELILNIIQHHFSTNLPLIGKKILVTAGPTFEAIDPIRFLGNNSSGLMGISIAEEAASLGAEVVLVCGPTNIEVNHPNIKRKDVVSAKEMYDACMNVFNDVNIIIMAAAVADYTPKEVSATKIKKEQTPLSIKLIPTNDILSEIGKRKNRQQFLVGFALETENELENAKQKLHNKNLDFIVLNSLKDHGAGFRMNTNKVFIIDRNDNIEEFELKSKADVAKDIIRKVISIMNQ